MSKRTWNRCDQCGRFIPLADFESGAAVRRLMTPDSDVSTETYEALCRDHALGDVEALAVEVIRLNTALALLKTEGNAAHVEAVATNAAWLEELERIAAFATRTPVLRLDAADDADAPAHARVSE